MGSKSTTGRNSVPREQSEEITTPKSKKPFTERIRRKKVSKYLGGFLRENDLPQQELHRSKFPKTPVLSRCNSNIKIDFESLMRAIRAHLVFTPPSQDIEVRDQPKYDSCTRYDVTDAQEDSLWTLEAKRLLEVVQNEPGELRFDSAGILESGNKEGFENLNSVSDQILCNLMICIHDNQLLALEHWPDLFSVDEYRSSKRVLTSRFDQQDVFDVYATRRSEQPPKRLANNNTEVYYSVIDYTTAVIAKLAFECAVGEYWQNNCLASLAKCATKLKILVRNPIKYAAVSLESANDLFVKEQALMLGYGISVVAIDVPRQDGQQKNDKQRQRASINPPMMDKKKEQAFAPEQDQAMSIYFLEMVIFQNWLSRTLRMILGSLKASSNSGFSTHAFEISSLVYGTGFSGMPTLLSQDRNGEITATSHSISVQNAYGAFEMTLAIANAIKEKNKLIDPPRPQPRREQATFLWELERKEDGANWKTDWLTISSMDDIISLIVPLLSSLSPVLTSFSELFDLVSLLSSVKNPQERFPPTQFTGLLSMRTDAYDSESVINLADDESRSLSRSLMAHQRLLSSENSLTSSTMRWMHKAADERQREVKKTQAEFQQLEKRIELEWTFDESSITVRCPKYVGIVMILAGILVFGGLTTGITVNNRLKGVDPFNITTFCWILATFLVLIAQSIRVENWPWRDFLRGRVVCRSVREICDVEKLNEQLVLLYLLHNESRLILSTRGPYNVPFRDSMANGFSIDVKPELRTLLLSGIIVVKVATPDGPALVCLDVRQKMDNRLASIEHFHSNSRENEILACTDLPRKGETVGPNRGEDMDIDLERTSMVWYRVIGLYNHPMRKFR